MRHQHRLILLLCLLLVACAKSSDPPAAALPLPSEPAGLADVPLPVRQPPVPAVAALLPQPDRLYIYALSDQPQPVTERFLRAGERLIGIQEGAIDVTWWIIEGVWRHDPQGNTLLRYLPPTLTADEQAWKQASDDAEVWFRLRRRTCADETDCWELTQLNRGERLTFHFVPERGITYAAREVFTDPDKSFIKWKAYEEGQPNRSIRRRSLPSEPPARLGCSRRSRR